MFVNVEVFAIWSRHKNSCSRWQWRFNHPCICTSSWIRNCHVQEQLCRQRERERELSGATEDQLPAGTELVSAPRHCPSECVHIQPTSPLSTYATSPRRKLSEGGAITHSQPVPETGMRGALPPTPVQPSWWLLYSIRITLWPLAEDGQESVIQTISFYVYSVHIITAIITIVIIVSVKDGKQHTNMSWKIRKEEALSMAYCKRLHTITTDHNNNNNNDRRYAE